MCSLNAVHLQNLLDTFVPAARASETASELALPVPWEGPPVLASWLGSPALSAPFLTKSILCQIRVSWQGSPAGEAQSASPIGLAPPHEDCP